MARIVFPFESLAMRTRSLAALLGLLCLCLPAAAQDMLDARAINLYEPAGITAMGAPFATGFSMPLSYSDQLRCSTALGRMGAAPVDLFPSTIVQSLATRNVSVAAMSRTDLPVRAIEPRSDPVYVGGEMGVLYGSSIGKIGGHEFDSYIFGTVGNEHFQITAGASYQETSIRFPQSRR